MTMSVFSFILFFAVICGIVFGLTLSCVLGTVNLIKKLAERRHHKHDSVSIPNEEDETPSQSLYQERIRQRQLAKNRTPRPRSEYATNEAITQVIAEAITITRRSAGKKRE